MVNNCFYEHYKGGIYKSFGIYEIQNTEFVLYKDENSIHWLRPLSMWKGKVNGKNRFKLIKNPLDFKELLPEENKLYIFTNTESRQTLNFKFSNGKFNLIK